MKLSRLVSREILHRKINFVISVLGVALAVASVIAVFSLLSAHHTHTGEILSLIHI